MRATRSEREFQLKYHDKVKDMPATIERLRTLLDENASTSAAHLYDVLSGIIEILEEMQHQWSSGKTR